MLTTKARIRIVRAETWFPIMVILTAVLLSLTVLGGLFAGFRTSQVVCLFGMSIVTLIVAFYFRCVAEDY